MQDEEVVVTSTRKRREITKDPRFGVPVKYEGLEPPKVYQAEEEIKPEAIKEPDPQPPKKVAKKEVKKARGKAIPAKSEDEKLQAEKRKKDLELSRERLQKLNACADFMLACLEPGYRQDWRDAAKEQRIHDIGLYVLGVLNRLSKMVDYMESDIEAEWSQGFIGYNENLHCDYCSAEIPITKTTHLKQRFCNNMCAKRYKEMNLTGIVFPVERPGPSEAQIEEKKWMHEAKREGVLSVG